MSSVPTNPLTDVSALPGEAPHPVAPPIPSNWSVAEICAHLGDIPSVRVRLDPPPGRATEADVVRIVETGDLCELVDGILVEKPVGNRESTVASALNYFLRSFLRGKGLGQVLSTDAMIRTIGRQIREPDVCYFSNARLQQSHFPHAPISEAAPELAVEVLSPSNTKKEMTRKLNEYFRSGTQLVWMIDPFKRTAEVYTAPDQVARLIENDVLDGGEVLPGFKLALTELFDEAGLNTD